MQNIFILILIYLVLNIVLSKKTCSLYIITLSLLVFLLYTLFTINGVENFFAEKKYYLYDANGDFLDKNNNKILIPVKEGLKPYFYNTRNITNISVKPYTYTPATTTPSAPMSFTFVSTTPVPATALKYYGYNSDNKILMIPLNNSDDLEYIKGRDSIVADILTKTLENLCTTTATLTSSQKSLQKMYCKNLNDKNYTKTDTADNYCGSAYLLMNGVCVKRKVCGNKQIVNSDNRCEDCPSNTVPNEGRTLCIVPSVKDVSYNTNDSLDRQIDTFYKKLVAASDKVPLFVGIMDKYNKDAKLPRILSKLVYLFDTNNNMQSVSGTNIPLKEYIFKNLDVNHQKIFLQNTLPLYSGWLELIRVLSSVQQDLLISSLTYKDRKNIIKQIPNLYDKIRDPNDMTKIVGFKMNILVGLSDQDKQRIVDDVGKDSNTFVDYINKVMDITVQDTNSDDL